MNKQYLWTLVLLVFLTLSFFSFFGDSDEKSAKTLQVPKQERHVKVSVVSPKSAKMLMSQTVLGITEARQKLTLNTLSEGILHVQIFEGQAVQKGDIIATVTHEQRKQTITALQSSIKLLERQIVREKSKLQSDKEMVALGIISKNALLDQENILEDKKIALNQIKTDLSRLELQNHFAALKAPANGYIEKMLPDGSYVTYGQSVCKVINSDVQVRLFVSPLVAKELHIGQKTTIEAEGISSEAKIVAMMPKSDNNLLDVIALPSKTLPVGLHIEAKIETARTEGWIIPKDSIVLVQNTPALFLIQNNKAVLHFITVQKDLIDKVLISDHLKAEDKVALKNAYMLHDGAVVEVIK